MVPKENPALLMEQKSSSARGTPLTRETPVLTPRQQQEPKKLGKTKEKNVGGIWN